MPGSVIDKFSSLSEKSKIFVSFLILFIVVVVAYWQIAFLQFSLRWDIIDVVFPFRFHFSECIQNGDFPLWNPYQQTGVPFYADLQVPSYYPELILVSLFGGYGIYTMHFLFIFYAFIAATGAYKLSFHFNRNHLSSILAGLVYAVSGFTIAHAQHFFLLVGAAWTPFVILYFLRMNESKRFTDVLKCALFIFLMLTGSYQALSVFLFYLLLILFLYFLILEIKKRDTASLFAFIKSNVILFVACALLCLPLIISTFEVFHSVGRLEEGVNIQKALQTAFTPSCFISFLYPFSTVKNAELFATDISMRNMYIGLVPLVLLLSALFRKQSILEYILLIFGLVVFTSSMGSFLPVREFMFRYVPMMNLYHTTPYVMVLSVLVMSVISANSFARLHENNDSAMRLIFIFASLLGIAIIAVLIPALGKINFHELSFLKLSNGFQHLLNNSSFSEHILLQAIIQIPILGAFLLLIAFRRRIRYFFELIVLLSVFDLVAASQLNSFYTAVDASFKPAQMKKDLALLPQGFPVPTQSKLIYNDQQSFAAPFWRNTYIFTKQIAFDSFSSFKLNSYSKLDDDYPNLKNAVLNNPPFYFSDNILPISQFNDSLIDPQKHSKQLFLDDTVFSKLKENTVSCHTSDRLQIVHFSPNKFSVETNTQDNCYFNVLQSNFAGWSAFVDGEEVPIYTSNFNYKTILLPKGKHDVSFRFKKDRIVGAYIFSYLIFAGLLLFLFARFAKRQNYPRMVSGSIILIGLAGLLILVGIRYFKSPNESTAHEQITQKWNKRTPLIQSELSSEQLNDPTLRDSIMALSGNKIFRIDSTVEYSPSMEIIVDNEKSRQGTIRFSASVFPKTEGKAVVVAQLIRDGQSLDWFGWKLETQIEQLNSWNKIEFLKNYHQLKLNDRLKIYIWNNGKIEMNIDEMQTRFYSF